MKISNTPVKIGSKLVKNRVTFAPTVKFDWTDTTGIAIERFARHYEARAAGGTGLIVVEATCICPEGRLAPSQLGLWEDGQIDGHRAITDACHRYGTVMLVQIHHGGYNVHPECGPAKGPSAVPWRNNFKDIMTGELSCEEILALRERFIETAVRAKRAGYDGVQLHACHGYLINDFVSPTTNKRIDDYGGSLENRTRFGCELIRGIHEACGSDFIVSARTPVAEPTIEEACAIADRYIEAGVDYLQLSLGIAPLNPEELGYPKDLPYNAVVWAGTMVRRHVAGRVPVSVVNGIRTPELANFILEQGLADTIDAACALLANPDWAKAVTEDAGYVPCRNCKFCLWGPAPAHRCPAVAERLNKGTAGADYRA
jgi:2,4-dienoyl-CoA reductase-like NADH-dependent reductase (Old Yellow Enzyme family)